MPAPARPARTIRYAATGTGVVDVWEPGPAPAGVTVALVHGGFWRAAYDRHHLEPLAAALARDGFAVASLEYPRIGMPGGGWPGTGTSVLDGLAAVRADPDLPGPVVAVGHSAGGHLVTWAGSSAPVPAGSGSMTEKSASAGDISPSAAHFPRLTGVVSLAGVVDLGLAARLGLGRGAAQELMGDADALAWATADPARCRLATPAVLLSGDADEDVPHVVSQSYLATRTAEDAPCEVRLLPGVGHMDLVDPERPVFAELVRAVHDLASPLR